MIKLLTLGYFIGVHIPSSNLYNYHPMVEVNESIMLFQNSFEKLSVAWYKTLPLNKFSLRVGATTGYYNFQKYKGVTYNVPGATDFGLAPFIVPTYHITDNVAISILGNSINAGLTYTFK